MSIYGQSGMDDGWNTPDARRANGQGEARRTLHAGDAPDGGLEAAAPGKARFAAPSRATRLLLVEDDRALSEPLGRTLELSGFTVYTTAYGEDALDLARAYRFDVVVLDLTLPDMPGQHVLQQLRQTRPDTPVIILSGETDLEAKIENFLEGADDYVTKPFHRDELVARIHAVVRRARSAAPQAVEIGPLAIDLVTHRALVNGLPVPLTGKEYACLEFLATRRGMTVTKEMFLAHLYGGRDEPEMKIIDVFICKLRRKLNEAGSPGVIETVWGRGYTIAADGN
ncbi:response regulator transcription factor [Sandaracinobacter sp. RS1-74]|uniref:response regulator transcription factor n=1 Tax=Sandaracinobacteroides sayramensis TaxID=2913411 RepID=UPI001EDBDF71|nr:response regulator transcription factor [Sandaracinobacteroides sayramensis]MCG2841897.1 response regulator transcription factor [Sandaracinobacteroides sayramensis]